jgi:hypothetical protein
MRLRTTAPLPFALLFATALACGPRPPSGAPTSSPPGTTIGDRDWMLATGDELERSFLAALPAVATSQVTDSALTLSGPGGVVARFRAR